MPGIESSQGTVVTFGGVRIGYLQGCDIEANAAGLADITSAISPVVGTGGNARVVRQYDCTAIEPPVVTLAFYGPPSYSAEDVGTQAQLVVATRSGQISGMAILQNWTYSLKPNSYSTGTATFQLTGG